MRVRTNRDSAYQSNLVANAALEAGYLRSIANVEGGFTTWKLDAVAGTASIVDPSGKMSGYTIKLDPMLGCVGVAPPRFVSDVSPKVRDPCDTGRGVGGVLTSAG